MVDIYLQKVSELANDIYRQKVTFNRLGANPALQEGLRKAGVLAIAASIVTQRCGCSVSDAQLDEESEYDRSLEQFSLVKGFAELEKCWYETPSQFESIIKEQGFSFYGYGGESRVFISDSIESVIKITSVSRCISPQRFFDRLAIHNAITPSAPLTVLGFTKVRTDDGYNLGVIVKQPFIEAKRELTGQEISSYMNSIGFDENIDAIARHTEFFNVDIIATDLGSNNVLITPGGSIVIIDGDFEFNTPGRGFGGQFVYGPDEQIGTME